MYVLNLKPLSYAGSTNLSHIEHLKHEVLPHKSTACNSDEQGHTRKLNDIRTSVGIDVQFKSTLKFSDYTLYRQVAIEI
jgi:hypothetical protein